MPKAKSFRGTKALQRSRFPKPVREAQASKLGRLRAAEQTAPREPRGFTDAAVFATRKGKRT